ncbi:MAG TPA: hypothetical protein VFN27_13180 [Xanthobacteraceae bacterium]|nr:hypothetical protein [Xanthobacteraceae bacterium]
MPPHRAAKAQAPKIRKTLVGESLVGESLVAVCPVAASVVAASGPRAAKPQIVTNNTDSKPFDFYPISGEAKRCAHAPVPLDTGRFPNPQFSWLWKARTEVVSQTGYEE